MATMLTVLTEPVSRVHQGPIASLVQFFEEVRGVRASVHEKAKCYGGHAAVTRSLLEGLTRLEVQYQYNPRFIPQVGDTVIVLAGIAPLDQAIAWKRAGRISTLLAGPNIVVRPTDYGGLIAEPEIDACIVPSQWVGTAYVEDAPTLAGRIKVWAAGVDERYWNGLRPHASSKTVLLYQKSVSEELGLACQIYGMESDSGGVWPLYKRRVSRSSGIQCIRCILKSKREPGACSCRGVGNECTHSCMGSRRANLRRPKIFDRERLSLSH
jgi:hypothetical protein